MEGSDKRRSRFLENHLTGDAIQAKFYEYQGTELTKEHPCPRCKDRNYRKHDLKNKIFAILTTKDELEKISVRYRRFWCRTCEKTFSADISKLFYVECLYGRPVVNLCLLLSSSMPPRHVEEYLRRIGIQVDSDMIRRYERLFGEDFVKHLSSSIQKKYLKNPIEFMFQYNVNNAIEVENRHQ